MKSAEMMLNLDYNTLSGKFFFFIYDTLELTIAAKKNFITPNN